MASHNQWSRIWSTHPWVKDCNFSRNQVVTSLWRFSCGHQSSQQRLGLHQKQHGCILSWSTKTRENFQGLEILHVLRDSNIATDVLTKLGSDRVKLPLGVFVGVTITLHKTTRWDNLWATSTNNPDHGNHQIMDSRLHRLHQRKQTTN
jgi:hypothetical protein